MLDLYPHQREAVDKLESGKILYGGVGTGKSRTAVAYYLEKEAPKDVYVITTARKRDSLDWETEFMRGGISSHMRHPETKAQLFVDSWNNIAKYKNVRGAFFIFDEQRLVGSGVWAKAFEHIAKHGNTWILLTATPGDTWLDYMSVFIANGFYKNRTEFKREHVVYSPHVKQFPKVDHYIGVGKLVRHRRSLLVKMEYLRHTTRVMIHDPVEYDEVAMRRLIKERWNPYEDKPIRSLAEYFYVMRKIVYSHPSRLEKVRKRLEEHKRIIVFYNFDYELETLRKLSDTVTVAEYNGHKHEDTPTGDRWVYLVQYMSGAEAWNCITTDTILFYSLNYSYRLFEQGQGRIDRLDTKYKILNYYVLLSEAKIDQGVLSAVNEKRNFNESAFAKKELKLVS